MKTTEQENEIVIAIIDETYRRNEETYETESQLYLKSLRDEFNEDFEESNVGPGADIPAFVTVLTENLLPLLPWLAAVFFSGKPLIDNIDAWRSIATRVRKYFSRPTVLNRNGAAAIAIESVMTDLGGTPRFIRLKSYRPAGIWEIEDFHKLSEFAEISDSPEVIQLGLVFHVFQIEADSVDFLVGIDGTRVLIRRVTP